MPKEYVNSKGLVTVQQKRLRKRRKHSKPDQEATQQQYEGLVGTVRRLIGEKFGASTGQVSPVGNQQKMIKTKILALKKSSIDAKINDLRKKEQQMGSKT